MSYRKSLVRFFLAMIGALSPICQLGRANQSSPFPVEVKQPDGTEIVLYMRGTEQYNWYEYVPEVRQIDKSALRSARAVELSGTRGYTVVKNNAGQYVFAQLNAAGDLSPTDQVVGRQEPPASLPRRVLPDQARIDAGIAQRMPPMRSGGLRASSVGDVQNLVVLMRFSNHKTRVLPSAADFTTIFNATGGNPVLAPTGSVSDFYTENSYGKMKLKSTVVGWVDLPQTESHYAGGNSGTVVGFHQAIRDALNLVVSNNLANFADFDNENGGTGDGRIDAITFIHSGYAAEWGGVDSSGTDFVNRIWSHRWAIPDWSSNPAGVKVSDYNVNPGLWATSGSDPGRIGVICHELGHFFGLPDLYDYSQKGEGVGSWCLMANSWGFDGQQHRPPHMSAWSKISLKWNTPTVISAAGVLDVKATASPGAQIYRINYPSSVSSSEYLLIENRQPLGNFEGGIPKGSDGVAGGLAIWHIDDAKPENDTPGFPGQPGWPSNGNRYKVALLQADGKYGLEQGLNRGDGDDLLRAGFRDKIDSTTVPTSNAYTGEKVLPIHSISASKETMKFTYGAPTTEGGETTKTCCPTFADGVVQYGLPLTGNAELTSVSIDLATESVVHATASVSLLNSTGNDVTTTIGLSNEPVSADPTMDLMWFPSLRFTSLKDGAWANVNTSGAIRLPAGSHKIYFKIWADSAKLQSDCGTLLVKAVPVSTSLPVTTMKTVAKKDRSKLQFSNSANERPANPGSIATSGSLNEGFDALVVLIKNVKDDPNLRTLASNAATDIALRDKSKHAQLTKAFSERLVDPMDDPRVRETIVKCLEALENR